MTSFFQPGGSLLLGHPGPFLLDRLQPDVGITGLGVAGNMAPCILGAHCRKVDVEVAG